MIRLGDEYQLRRDIDKILDKTYNYEEDIWNIYTKDEVDDILDEKYYDKSEVDDLIGSGGGGDLSDYVRKDEFLDLFDVDFDYELGNPLVYRDGQLMLDIFLKEK